MEQGDAIHQNVITVLAHFYPHGIKISAFFFTYEIITGTKFPKHKVNTIQYLPGVQTYYEDDEVKKKTKKSPSNRAQTKKKVMIVKLTQQGYETFKKKNPVKSLSVTEIKKNLSDDFPDHEIFYSNDYDKIEEHLLSLISKETSPIVIGFDTEWFPDVNNKAPLSKTALVQLAFTNHAVLIHLIHTSKVPPTLIEILKNPKYIKTCQDPRQDIDRLMKGYGLVIEGMTDLKKIAKKYQLKDGLNNIYNQVSGKNMSPTPNALTNWEAIPLKDTQILYAAIDAIQSRESMVLLHKVYAKEEEDMFKWIESNQFWFQKHVPVKTSD